MYRTNLIGSYICHGCFFFWSFLFFMSSFFHRMLFIFFLFNLYMCVYLIIYVFIENKKHIKTKKGTPQIDLFATEENHRLPVYCSPIADPNAFAIDALSFSWSNLHAYAYPPSVLISKILNKAARDSCKLTLVAPLWIRSIWIWDLIHASSDRPL